MSNQSGFGSQLGAGAQPGSAGALRAGGSGDKADEDEDDMPDLEPADDPPKGGAADEDDGDFDETNIDPKDIELVMQQASLHENPGLYLRLSDNWLPSRLTVAVQRL